MKNFFSYVVTISSVLLLNTSCEQDIDVAQEFIIAAGTQCGWCVGNDSVYLTAKSFCYTKFYPCEQNESERTIDTCGQVDDLIWNELMASVDFEVFKSIDINTCNVCADGCDNWIRIETPTDSHYIRFGYEDSVIVAPVSDFIKKVDEVLKALRESTEVDPR